MKTKAISITGGEYGPEQLKKLNTFLSGFLPKMRRFPGVLAIYHYVRPEHGDDSTIVIWESEESLKAYRQSELIKEAIAFEKELGSPAVREAYPLDFAL